MGETAIVTGSSGLIGSELVRTLDRKGWKVEGIDNNMRRALFGERGDTRKNLRRLAAETTRYHHHDLDVRDRQAVLDLVKETRPSLVVHCAAQPSHELSAARPVDDIDINVYGTVNLLEASRRYCGETPFVFFSTNKVYGDAPNEIELVELETRWDFADPRYATGIDETMRVDRSLHSVFGASKLAADVIVQEYGRYFDLPTCCFRSSCVTGATHAGVELHGFLAYLADTIREDRVYRIFGYLGKQVRDNLHASDACSAVLAFAASPRVAAVYNLGGGRENSCSVREAIAALETLCGRSLRVEYQDEHRRGDHVCYISDTRRFRRDYPGWSVSVTLDEIYRELLFRHERPRHPASWPSASRS